MGKIRESAAAAMKDCNAGAGVFPASDILCKLSSCLRLVKFRLVSLSLLSCCAGFVLGTPGTVRTGFLAAVMAASGALAAGGLALNQWMEQKFDRLMVRTERRPLPAGDLSGVQALAFGLGLTALGALGMFFFVNLQSLFFGVLTLVLYLGFYTPMKRWTPLSVHVGAIAGALPVFIGWTAANPVLTGGAWSLFSLLFFWQWLHFSLIAWVYREDYSRGGFVFLELKDSEGVRTGQRALAVCGILFGISFIPAGMHLAGVFYAGLACVLGSMLIFLSLRAIRDMKTGARPLMHASVLYLFALLTAMILDRI